MAMQEKICRRVRRIYSESDAATHHGLPGNRLHEAVQQLAPHAHRDARPAQRPRVAVHALLPVDADRLHGRHARVWRAPVLRVLPCTHRHLGQQLRHRLLGLLLHVRQHCRVEAVEDVDDKADHGQVQRVLRVAAEDVWELGVCRDELEEAGNPALLGLLLGL